MQINAEIGLPFSYYVNRTSSHVFSGKYLFDPQLESFKEIKRDVKTLIDLIYQSINLVLDIPQERLEEKCTRLIYDIFYSRTYKGVIFGVHINAINHLNNKSL